MTRMDENLVQMAPTKRRRWELIIAFTACCVGLFFIGFSTGTVTTRAASVIERQQLIVSYTHALNSKDALIYNLTHATVKATDAVLESSSQHQERANIVIGDTEQKALMARREAEEAQRRAAQIRAEARAREAREKRKLEELR